MLAPGTVIDSRYEILGLLGAGGMGQVYRARRTMLGDEVALKVMSTSFDADEQSGLRQRFLLESRACAQLHHPHIVSILDFNIDAAGQPYLVMELLTGPSLRDELELSGAMAPADVVSILRPVAAALQMAHDRGITHRDLKPGNIVAHRYDSGERVYKVIDFGLASIRENDAARLTAPNMFLGTLAYAAPEQLNGEPADARTDLYAMGVVAYEMLVGRRPFEASEAVTLIQQTLTGAAAPPSVYRSVLPGAVDPVIMRAIAKNRDARWPTVTEFVRALDEALGSQPVSAARPRDALLTRYELETMLGPGRLGSLVYRGRHRALRAEVAIRVLRREGQNHWEAVRDRFLVEAQTLQVSHPNVLRVHDYGEDDRVVFVVTDYVDGPSLREEIAVVGGLPWTRAANLLAQMLDAATTVNAHGGFVVGVNPDMIRLDRTDAVERLVMSTAGITSVQDVLATMREQELRGEEANEQELPFVAPEVLMGRGPAATADVFTIGVLAYLMTTGTLPFRGPSLPELIGQMLQTTPAAPRALAPDIPEAASVAIARALSSDPARRFQNVAAFRASALA